MLRIFKVYFQALFLPAKQKQKEIFNIFRYGDINSYNYPKFSDENLGEFDHKKADNFLTKTVIKWFSNPTENGLSHIRLMPIPLMYQEMLAQVWQASLYYHRQPSKAVSRMNFFCSDEECRKIQGEPGLDPLMPLVYGWLFEKRNTPVGLVVAEIEQLNLPIKYKELLYKLYLGAKEKNEWET